MIRFDQWMLPDGETHLPEWMSLAKDRREGILRYQGAKYDAALRCCPRRRVAVDVGSHVGLWSRWLAQDFDELHAFEPKAEHRACFLQNVPVGPSVTLHAVALGAADGEAGLITGPASSGDTRLVPGGTGCEVRTLDSFQFPIVDFLKLDCEGYEVFVLEGAIDTLRRCRPTVIVEQKPGHGQVFGRGEHDAVRLLESLGALRQWESNGDYVLTFPEVA